jgi:hypothetical protein
VPHLITSDRIVAKFGPPTGGVNQLLPASDLPTHQLRDASNVLTREAILRPRPGYRPFAATTLTGTPTGIFPYYRGANDPVPVLATTSRLYAYTGGAWTDVTGAALTASTRQLGRFTMLTLGTPPVSWVLHSNGQDAPRRWDGVAGTFTSVPEGPPVWSDLCTIQDHVIGIVPPYGIQWGSIRALDVWPALNVRQLSDTPDPVVAIRPFGQAGTGVLYKQRSSWFVTYTGAATEAQAFAFQLIGFYDGPASPAAVVDVQGAHILMTSTGRIGVFSGTRMDWVGDLLWPKLRADIAPGEAGRIFGVYDPTYSEVTFVYPSLAAGSAMRGVVVLTVPRPAVGLLESGAFPGLLAGALSAGGTVRLTDLRDQVLVAGTTANRTYEWTTESEQDDAEDFGGFWQTGLVPTPGMDPFRLEAVEIFAERGVGYGQMQVQAVTSWTLAGDGTLAEAAIGRAGDLEAEDEPIRADTGLKIHGRFLGLRCSFTAARTSHIRFKGATFFAQKRSV